MVELVWDARLEGTGRAGSGASVRVGEDAHFSPEDLLGLAAASCVMRSFLKLVAGEALPILSYLSTAEVVHGADDGGPARVRVEAYITAAHAGDRNRLMALADRARQSSPIACLLGDRVEIVPDFRVIEGAVAEPTS